MNKLININKKLEENNLQRFIKKQEEDYETAFKEIKNGEKKSCWMWYIFPQIRGLGMSTTSNYYGIQNIEEAIEYLQNEKLKNNLLEITQALLDLGDVDIRKVMGCIDDSKLKSSMTLFNEVENISGIDCGHIFEKVLHQFFKDEKDEKTLKILEKQKRKIKNNPNIFESDKVESNENEFNNINENNDINKIQGDENINNIDKQEKEIIIEEKDNEENKKKGENIILRNNQKENVNNYLNDEEENGLVIDEIIIKKEKDNGRVKLEKTQNYPTEKFQKNKENQSENNEKNIIQTNGNENNEEEIKNGEINELKVESHEDKNAKCCEGCNIM